MVFIPRPIPVPRPRAFAPRVPRAPRPVNVYHHTTVIVHQSPAYIHYPAVWVHYPLVWVGLGGHHSAWVWALVVISLLAVPAAGFAVVILDEE